MQRLAFTLCALGALAPLALASNAAADAAASSVGFDERRFVRDQPLSREAADWVSTFGDRIVFGAGRSVTLASLSGDPGARSTWELPREVTDGVLTAGALFLVEGGGRLVTLDPTPGAMPRPVQALPAGGAMRLALLDGLLAATQSGRGVWLLELSRDHVPASPPGASRTGSGARLSGSARLIPFQDPSVAIAASPGLLHVALASGEVLDIPQGAVTRTGLPVGGSRRFVGRGVRQLAAGGSTLYALGEGGLRLLEASGRTSIHESVAGRSLSVAGRRLFVAAGPGGLARYRDRMPAGQLHVVTLVNNAFSPADITVEVGDSVRWNNGFDFHNVFSCNAEQTGCQGEAANEVFTSGQGANGPWSYTYAFTAPGDNRYLCQPHASFMWGRVTVLAPVTTPPAVPAGAPGTPVTVDRPDPAEATLVLNWDTESCDLAPEHLLVYGTGRGLPASPGGRYRVRGSVCGLGPDSPFIWQDSPSPAPGEFLWWLIIAGDGAQVEGSWGQGSAGERAGPGEGGASNRCGMTTKSIANTCGL